jgi:selenocysteine lyase/cysteine desulfurase
MSKNELSRRHFLQAGLATGALTVTSTSLPASARDWDDYVAHFSGSLGDSLPAAPIKPDDDTAWKAIAKNYSVTSKITNLENAYWGIMALPVLNEYKRLTEFVNRENTHFARLQWAETYRGIRESVAKFLNVGVDEIALTRGATESLQALIGGYNKLKPGDTVLYADLDYAEMKTAMRWLKERRGVKPIKVTFPEPTANEPLSEAKILAFYEKALSDNPGTKLLLLTHLNNLTGMIIPVAKIARMAKDRGIAVILDAAHSVGQVDLKLRDLGCDFIGFNLHKWIGAPIGCGVIYINKVRIDDIDTFMLKSPGSTAVTDRIDTGTSNFAAHMAIPAAIGFHNKIGTAAKEERLRYLRNLWVEPARKLKGLTILAPDDTKMVAGLTSFRLDGVLTTKANDALVKHLADKFGVLTVRRTGPDAGDCIRVTPSIYTSGEDVMKLVNALRTITATPHSW